MAKLLKFNKNMYMNHKELIDQVSANLIREGGKLETRKSWLVIRNYLQQLSEKELRSLLKDIA